MNWAAFPYTPDVEFRIAHTEDAILLHFKVREASVRAVAGHDNGPVWEDACVEFFSVPADDGVYYNMECNCAGTLLIGAGAGRGNRQHAPQEVLDKVQRWASLGREAFDERVGECAWEVALVIPYSAFFLHDITSLDGKTLPCQFFTNAVTSSRLPISFPGSDRSGEAELPLPGVLRYPAFRVVVEQKITSTCPHHYHRFSETPYSSPFQGE